MRDLLPDRLDEGAVAHAKPGGNEDGAASRKHRQAVDERAGDMKQRKTIDHDVVRTEIVHERCGSAHEGLVTPGVNGELRRASRSAGVEIGGHGVGSAGDLEIEHLGIFQRDELIEIAVGP